MALFFSSTLWDMFFPGGSMIKNLPAIQEAGVQSLDQEDLLKKKMATHSNILFWKIQWTGYSSRGHKRVENDLETKEQLPFDKQVLQFQELNQCSSQSIAISHWLRGRNTKIWLNS